MRGVKVERRPIHESLAIFLRDFSPADDPNALPIVDCLCGIVAGTLIGGNWEEIEEQLGEAFLCVVDQAISGPGGLPLLDLYVAAVLSLREQCREAEERVAAERSRRAELEERDEEDVAMSLEVEETLVAPKVG